MRVYIHLCMQSMAEPTVAVEELAPAALDLDDPPIEIVCARALMRTHVCACTCTQLNELSTKRNAAAAFGGIADMPATVRRRALAAARTRACVHARCEGEEAARGARVRRLGRRAGTRRKRRALHDACRALHVELDFADWDMHVSATVRGRRSVGSASLHGMRVCVRVCARACAGHNAMY